MAKKRVFQGPLPKGATKKEELVFRKTGITLTPVRKFQLKDLKKIKKISFTVPEGIDLNKARMVLKARQKRTLIRVIESEASPSSKARARLMLVKLQ